MFGLNDNTNNNYADTTQLSASDTASVSQPPALDSAPPAPVNSAQPSTADAGSQPPNGAPPESPPLNTGMPSPQHPPVPSNPSSIKAPPSGIADVSLENAYIDNGPLSSPKPDGDQPSTKPTAASLLNGSHEDDLLKLKQQALQSLAPLVDHLEQDPEEKFKTTMMMIQASDNADLIPEAYEAANQIPDEKVRAQALLDVVNEINYFTQHAADK
jgi:hypothetical protein